MLESAKKRVRNLQRLVEMFLFLQVSEDPEDDLKEFRFQIRAEPPRTATYDSTLRL